MEFRKGMIAILTTDKAFREKSKASFLFVDYEELQRVVRIGMMICLGEGKVYMRVVSKRGNTCDCEVLNDYDLKGFSYVTVIGADIELPCLSDSDEDLLRDALGVGFDVLVASFVRSGDAVRGIREFLGEKGKNVLIFPKLQSIQAIKNMDAIVQEADG